VRELLALSSSDSELVEVSLKPNFRTLGQRYGKQTPLVAGAISAQDHADLAAQLRANETISLKVEGLDQDQGIASISLADVVITETPKEGWAVASEAGDSVALDLEITPELARAGLARDIVRAVQEARKNAGFDISDRITLWWDSTESVFIETMSTHETDIAHEVLALEVIQGSGPADAFNVDNDLGASLTIAKRN